MRMNRIIAVVSALCLSCLITACKKTDGSRDVDVTLETGTELSDASEKYTVVSADGDGNVVIPVDQITESASFYNYDAEGVTVQLVAIRDKDGAAHISFNTCQSCSPSPKAYYVQKEDTIQCANCGSVFAPAQVGVAHGGCNPWPIEGVRIGDDTITVPVSSINSMRSRFTSWKGPTE